MAKVKAKAKGSERGQPCELGVSVRAGMVSFGVRIGDMRGYVPLSVSEAREVAAALLRSADACGSGPLVVARAGPDGPGLVDCRELLAEVVDGLAHVRRATDWERRLDALLGACLAAGAVDVGYCFALVDAARVHGDLPRVLEAVSEVAASSPVLADDRQAGPDVRPKARSRTRPKSRAGRRVGRANS